MDRQSDFVRSLASTADGEGDVADPLNRVAILWRKDAKRIKLEWMRAAWQPAQQQQQEQQQGAENRDASYNSSQEELRKALQRLLSANEVSFLT